MARQETQHAESYILGLDVSERQLDHPGVAIRPIRVEDAGVDAKAYSVAVLLASLCCFDTLIQRCRAKLVSIDDILRIETPGNNDMAIRLNG